MTAQVAQSDDATITHPDTPKRARQVAALAWRPTPSGVDVLLVTSRTTRRWVLPKGWPVKGKSMAESAAQEAFEEAGVWGPAAEQPIGSYGYDKVLSDGTALPCTVDVFPIRVQGLLATWPEVTERRRRWYSAMAAAGQVAEPELSRLLMHCQETLDRLAA